MSDSPFLQVPKSDWVAQNPLCFALRDNYPVSPGHTLIITRRVVPTWFEATPEEQAAILDLIEVVKRQLDAGEPKPDGYNVGFNAGEAAGQTVPHLHVHVIPRYRGDMDDPRGGVRHVIPSKGNYTVTPHPLATGGEDDPFARHVLPLLQRARQVAIVAAFVQESGLVRIQTALEAALHQGASVRLLTGDYLDITQASALEMLLDWQTTWREPDDIDAGAAAADPGADAGPDAPADTARTPGTLEARVVETAHLPGPHKSFHPQASSAGN